MTLRAGQLGVTPDFELTHQLARLFRDNRTTVDQSLPLIEDRVQEHRRFFKEEARWKEDTLSYRFLTDVYGNEGISHKELEDVLIQEADPVMQSLPATHAGALAYMRERLSAVNRDIASQWWYIVWDEWVIDCLLHCSG